MYYIVCKDNRNEFVFVGENRTRTIDLAKAKQMAEQTIKDFDIPIARTVYDVGECVCGSEHLTNGMFAVAVDNVKILGEPQTVIYRNMR